MPLEVLLRDTPQEKLDWQVSSSDLTEIARKLSQWRLLAPHLQVTLEQEKEIVRDHPSNLQLQSLKCLQKWSHDQDSKATYGALITTLHRLENIDLIDEICTLLSTQAFPSPPPDRTLMDYASVLRDTYARMKLPGLFEALTGDDEDVPAPSERYINLVMTNRERIQRGGVDKEHMGLALQGNTSGMADYMSKKNLKVHIDVCDLFALDNKEYKVVLIEGAPGSGKTTLLRYITQKWGSGELFCQFSLVLLIQFRDIEVQKAKCLADLIPFVFNSTEKDAIAKKIAKKDGKGVLLLFDGWDELPTDMQSKSFLRDIIVVPHKHSLLKAAVVVSARPISSTSMQKHITTRIEILGFTPKQIEMYVKESLSEKEAEDLMAAIKQDAVLQGNCYLPLSTAIITHTYICMGHALPATFCRIIMELALSCLYRHIKKNTPYGYLYVTLNSFDDLQNTERKQFNSLCNKAYSSLLREEYSIHDPNMPTLGLVQSVQSFVVRGKSTQHYFLHLSLQELCAARHFISLPTDEQISLFRDFMELKAVQMLGVLSFYAALGGLDSTRAKEVFNQYCHRIFNFQKHMTHGKEVIHTSEKINKVDVNPLSMLFNHAYESQNPEICQLLPSAIDTHKCPLSTRDIIAIAYIISKKKVEWLNLRNDDLSVSHLKLLAPALKENMPNKLNIVNTSIGDDGITIIANSIKSTTSLTALTIANNGMTDVSAKVLGQALCYSTIMALFLHANKIGSAGLINLVSYLPNTNVVILNVSDCDIGDEGIIFLSSILPRTKLAMLGLGGNYISRKGLNPLADAIMSTKMFCSIYFTSALKKAICLEDIKHFLLRIQLHPMLSEVSINADFQELDVFMKQLNITRSGCGLGAIKLTAGPQLRRL